MAHYRTAWISDIHLGTRGSKAQAVLDFLRDHEFDTLYLVGDIIDIWALRRGIYWPQEHNDVVQKLLRKARKGSTVIYIPGNHDEFVSHFLGHFGAITLKKNDIHTTADGKRILVIHGHELDAVIQNLGWLAHVGDWGYKILLELNGVINYARRFFGYEYWSLSAYVKNEVKNVVSFIGDFENAVVRYAREYRVDAVLCGHIHHAAIRKIDTIDYYNAGDWVESCSALVEHHDGKIELLKVDLFSLSPGTIEALSEESPTEQPLMS
ncbi:MAG: UDP-2,3-diacylglucosamine diphosphatase [Blastochloris sp.]|nr:UDP-2,3-diacylglucosamine diphosphatase [Blastochloris sp.]